jgi:hypothetical protein
MNKISSRNELACCITNRYKENTGLLDTKLPIPCHGGQVIPVRHEEIVGVEMV